MLNIQKIKWQIGVDEVGRGCVAGPVCVGIVAIPISSGIYTSRFLQQLEEEGVKASGSEISQPLNQQNIQSNTTNQFGNISGNKFWNKLRDSKKTKPEYRRQVFAQVEEICGLYQILQASNQLVDKYGIAVCIRHLMFLGLEILALKNPELKSSLLFLDGTLKLISYYDLDLLHLIFDENIDEMNRVNIDKNYLISKLQQQKSDENTAKNIFQFRPLSNFQAFKLQKYQNGLEEFKVVEENFADDKFLSVALASNLAKHFRDEAMIKYSTSYPEYLWHKNMGYGTAQHMEAIKKYGLTNIHRFSFLKRYLP